MEKSNYYNSRRLTTENKEFLFASLLKKEGLIEKDESIMNSLSNYLSEVLLKELIPNDLIVDVNNSREMLIYKQGEILFKGSMFDLSDEKDFFPNDIVSVRDYNKNTNIKVTCSIFIPLSSNIPKLNMIFNIKEDREIIKLIPEKCLITIKNLYLELIKNKYYISNFLIDYFPNKANLINRYQYYNYGTTSIKFLDDKTTWGQVKKINKDWYNLLIERYLPNENLTITPEDELKSLKMKLNL